MTHQMFFIFLSPNGGGYTCRPIIGISLCDKLSFGVVASEINAVIQKMHVGWFIKISNTFNKFASQQKSRIVHIPEIAGVTTRYQFFFAPTSRARRKNAQSGMIAHNLAQWINYWFFRKLCIIG